MGSCFKSLAVKSIFAAVLILFSSASMANTVSWGSFNGTPLMGILTRFQQVPRAMRDFQILMIPFTLSALAKVGVLA
jgi:hypothetical protein